MIDIHPHWQTGDCTEAATPPPTHVVIASHAPSRRPAAIIGVAMVTTLLVGLGYGFDFSDHPDGSSLVEATVAEPLPVKTTPVSFLPSDHQTDDLPPLSETIEAPKPQPMEEPPLSDQSSLLPENPYTVGSNRSHPFDASGTPVENTSVLHAGAPLRGILPERQPETGSNQWPIAIASILALLALTGRSLTITALDFFET